MTSGLETAGLFSKEKINEKKIGKNVSERKKEAFIPTSEPDSSTVHLQLNF